MDGFATAWMPIVKPQMRVISGGQTGVDQGALRAAMDAGLEVGGWCPPGRRCEDGAIPSRFPLRETPAEHSPGAPEVPRSLRTEWNVRDADATLVIAPREEDPGTAWTIRCAEALGRPWLRVDPSDDEAASKILAWLVLFFEERFLEESRSFVLNVAGPSEGTVPGVGERVYDLLRPIFRELVHGPDGNPGAEDCVR